MSDLQIVAWLKAKARLTDAEAQLLRAKRRLINAKEQRWSVLDPVWRRDESSTTFYQEGWPEGATVGGALRECRDAERAFEEADAALSPADRKLLKSVHDLWVLFATAAPRFPLPQLPLLQPNRVSEESVRPLHPLLQPLQRPH